MGKKISEEQRKKIISKLVEIIKASEEINAEIQKTPHLGDIVHSSLKPKSGMYIVYSSKGFTARYNIDDKSYEINIHKR